MTTATGELLSISEAARVLGLSLEGVRQLITRGLLPALRPGPRRWALRAADVEACAKRRQEDPPVRSAKAHWANKRDLCSDRAAAELKQGPPSEAAVTLSQDHHVSIRTAWRWIALAQRHRPLDGSV